MNLDLHQTFCPLLHLSPHLIRETTTSYYPQKQHEEQTDLQKNMNNLNASSPNTRADCYTSRPNRIVRKTVYRAEDLATGEGHDVWVLESKSGAFASVGDSEVWNSRLRSLTVASNSTPGVGGMNPLIRIDDGYTTDQQELTLVGEAAAVLVTERCVSTAFQCYENGTLSPEMFCMLTRTLRRGLGVLHDAGTLHGGFSKQCLSGSTESTTPVRMAEVASIHQTIMMGLACLGATSEGDWKLTNYAFFSATTPLEALAGQLPPAALQDITTAKKKAELSDAFAVLEAVLYSKCDSAAPAPSGSSPSKKKWAASDVLRCATSLELSFQIQPVLPVVELTTSGVTSPPKIQKTPVRQPLGKLAPSVGNQQTTPPLVPDPTTKSQRSSQSASNTSPLEKKTSPPPGEKGQKAGAVSPSEKENTVAKTPTTLGVEKVPVTPVTSPTSTAGVVPEPARVSPPVLGEKSKVQNQKPAALTATGKLSSSATPAPTAVPPSEMLPVVTESTTAAPTAIPVLLKPTAAAAPTLGKKRVDNSTANNKASVPVVAMPTRRPAPAVKSRSPSPLAKSPPTTTAPKLVAANSAKNVKSDPTPAATTCTVSQNKSPSPTNMVVVAPLVAAAPAGTRTKSPPSQIPAKPPISTTNSNNTRKSPSPALSAGRGRSGGSPNQSSSSSNSLSPASTCSLDGTAAQHEANYVAARTRLADVCANIRTPPVSKGIPKPGSDSIGSREGGEGRSTPRSSLSPSRVHYDASSPRVASPPTTSRTLSFETSGERRDKNLLAPTAGDGKRSKKNPKVLMPSIPPLPPRALLHKHRLAVRSAQQSRMRAQGFDLEGQGGSPGQTLDETRSRSGSPYQGHQQNQTQSRSASANERRNPVDAFRSREDQYRVLGPSIGREAWSKPSSPRNATQNDESYEEGENHQDLELDGAKGRRRKNQKAAQAECCVVM